MEKRVGANAARGHAPILETLTVHHLLETELSFRMPPLGLHGPTIAYYNDHHKIKHPSVDVM